METTTIQTTASDTKYPVRVDEVIEIVKQIKGTVSPELFTVVFNAVIRVVYGV